jgi:Co/Zn/Cd efflux system component
MTGCCHNDHCSSEPAGLNSLAWRRALWIALAINAGMFAGELIAGIAAGSAALQADALDFLGDAGNYAIGIVTAALRAYPGRACRQVMMARAKWSKAR